VTRPRSTPRAPALACGCLLATSCLEGSSERAAVSPHWEYYDDHPVYAVPDPRDLDRDRSSRVNLGSDLETMREYTLNLINAIRRGQRAAPLLRDPLLDDFAQEGSVFLSLNHRPHHHFETLAGSCGCNAGAENQGSPSGWPPGPPDTQIAEMVGGMMDEGPGGGHHDALVSPAWRRLGVGILNPGGRMYFTLDFGI